MVAFHLLFVFLLGKLQVIRTDRAFRDGQNREALARLCSLVDGLDDLVYPIRDLWNQDDIRSSGNSGVQGQPANLVPHDLDDKDTVPHDLDDKDTVVRCRRRVDAVNRLRRDIDSAVEPERHVSSPDIIVNGLRQMDDIESLLAQKIRCLLAPVPPEDIQAVQAKLVVVLHHRFNLVQPVLVRVIDRLEGRAGRSKDCSALCQNAREILACQKPVIPVNHALVPVHEPIYFQLVNVVGQCLYDAAHGRIQCLAIAPGSQQTYSLHSAPCLSLHEFHPLFPRMPKHTV